MRNPLAVVEIGFGLAMCVRWRARLAVAPSWLDVRAGPPSLPARRGATAAAAQPNCGHIAKATLFSVHDNGDDGNEGNEENGWNER